MASPHLRHWTIAVSLASLFFILPHVVEDFAEGIAERAGLSTGVGAFLLGGLLALQSLGLILIGQGRPVGFIVTGVVGLVWVAGALVDHGPALLGGGFREGAISGLWVVGLITTQAASSVLAWWGFWKRGA